MKMILIALAALAVAAPAAQASTVSYAPDGALTVTAGPGEKNKLGIQSTDDPGRVVVYEGTPGLTVDAPSPCTPQGADAASCPLPAQGVRVNLGDGDDWGYISFDLPHDIPMAISGGPGNDRLQSSNDGQPTTLDGGPGDDTLQGGPSTDTLIGGDGDDTLEGREAADHLDGGAGDDVLSGDGNTDVAPDTIDGGPGTDTIATDWEDAGHKPVSLTLGGGADDGRPGEGDDVRDVEHVSTYAASTISGTDADETLEVVQTTAPSTISGNGGNDTIKASDGADRIDGGAGDDAIDGGFGNDTITGGPGRDDIAADARGGDCGPVWCKYPFGNDTVYAQDGEQDSITCGFGEDTVYADAIDVVDGDCEHVIRSGAPAGGGTTANPAPKLGIAVARTKLASALAHGLKLRVTTPAAGTLTARSKYGSGSVDAKAAGTTTVTLRFTKKARASLRHKRSVKLSVAVNLGSLDGSLVVTLKR